LIERRGHRDFWRNNLFYLHNQICNGNVYTQKFFFDWSLAKSMGRRLHFNYYFLFGTVLLLFW
jgi:hypothetical protein